MALKKEFTGGIWNTNIQFDDYDFAGAKIFKMIISGQDDFQPLHAFGRTPEECEANARLGAASVDLLCIIEMYLDANASKDDIVSTYIYQCMLQTYERVYGKPYKYNGNQPFIKKIDTGHVDGLGNKIFYPGKVQTRAFNETRVHDLEIAAQGDRGMLFKAGGYMLDTIYFAGAGELFKYLGDGSEK